MQLISVLPLCHNIEVDIMVTSLLSQLQCRIYPSDGISSLITTLVDGLKCLAKDPLQFMENKELGDMANDCTSSISQTVSLESVLAIG